MKTDFGKYLVIFLFLILLISLVSGFMVSDNNFKISYDEGFTKYNIEDGHITFDKLPPAEVLNQIEEGGELKLYPLSYFEEYIADGKKLRVYQNRDEVDTACVMSGRLAETDSEIAVDRMFAQNNGLSIGDRITMNDLEYEIVGLVALVDYSCLYENNTDMMFDAINFGVGVTTKEGFERCGSIHFFNNYAWKYNEPYTDDTQANEKSEKLIDVLEDVIKEYDISLLQVQVDALYDRAEGLAADLEDAFKEASDSIEEKLKDAGESAVTKAIESMDTMDKINALLDKAGMTMSDLASKVAQKVGITDAQLGMILQMYPGLGDFELMGAACKMMGISDSRITELALSEIGLSDEDAAEALLDAYNKKHGTTTEALVAQELGTTEDKLKAMQDAMENLEDDMDSEALSAGERIDLHEIEDADSYENEMEFSFDSYYDLLDRIEECNLYDCGRIRSLFKELETLADFKLDDSEVLGLEDYVPRYLNMAINFTGEDMGGDAAMFQLFNYIVIIILAFVFAVTISNTIAKEAGVLGTLRASGYTRGEMVRHFMTLPMWVTVIAAAIGNVLGYTVFKNVFVAVYYNTYSLATYEDYWNWNAFINTTVVPVVMMFVINLVYLSVKMRLTPLQFLRHQLSKKRKKKAMHLSKKLPIMTRFRLRILFQNIPAYITMVFGIVLGAVIIIFGNMFEPLLDDYAQMVVDSRICEYQYVLMEEEETQSPQAEKYGLESLEMRIEGYKKDSISVFGIADASAYIHTEIPKGQVLISNGITGKYKYNVGDELVLNESYGNKKYTLEIAGTYNYDAGMAVFMNLDDFRKLFNKDEDDFAGYFSNEELTDLDPDKIATVISIKDLTKMSDQLKHSMGDFMSLFRVFGVIMFLLLMYLMTKQIIEKNMISISLVKILGFKGGEIGGLYLVISSVVVAASLLISIPLVDILLRWAFSSYLYTEMSGYIPYIVSPNCYIIMVALGVVSYVLVSVFMMIKIRRIPKSEALKNVE